MVGGAAHSSREGGDGVRNGVEEEQIAEQRYSEAYLQRVTGEEDLAAVRSLVLTVDSNDTQVDHLGTLMPLLSELRLERGSTLASFRDLGSSLANLRVLWLAACGIRHLDGVGALSGLEELYLAFNDVEDLTSIALHDRLEVLDLESNSVRDAEQAIQLGTCSRLWSLTLTANPVCRERCYRRMIVEAVPQLASLDEEDVTDDDRRPPSTSKEADDPDLPDKSLKIPSKDTGPSHRHPSPPPNTADQPPPEGPKTPHLQQFPLGSVGTGNRNLRELELSDPYRSYQDLPRGAVVPSTSSASVEPRENTGKAAAATRTSNRLPWMTRDRWTPQPPGRLRNHSCEGELPEEAKIPVDTPRRVLRCSRGEKPRGVIPEAGDVEDGDDAEPDDSDGAEQSRDMGIGLEVFYRHETPPRGEKASSAAVDEEEMVVRAIKNFRLLSNVANPESGRNNPDSRCRVAPLRVTPCSGVSRVAANGVGKTWTAVEGGTGMEETNGSENRSQPSQRGGREGESATMPHSARSVRGREEAPQSGGARRGRDTCGASQFCEGKDWLLKVLSLEDMGLVSKSQGTRRTDEGTRDAASALTHGSQMSIAGNPAYGLRRRRVVDPTLEAGGDASSSTSASLEPRQAQTRQPTIPFAARDDVENKRESGKSVREGTDRRHPSRSDGPKPGVRHTGTGAGEVGCAGGSDDGEPSTALNRPSTSDRPAPVGGGGGAPPALAGCTLGLPRRLFDSDHDAVAERYGGAPGHRRQPGSTPVASLCCRALLSPPTKHRQSRPRRALHRPGLASRDMAPPRAGSSDEGEGVGRVGGACLSPPSGEPEAIVAPTVAASAYSRPCKGIAGPRERPRAWGVLNSRSAASLAPPRRIEAAGDYEEVARLNRPTRSSFALHCGAGSTISRSTSIASFGYPDGGDSAGTDSTRSSSRQDSGPVGKTDGGVSSRGHVDDTKNGLGCKPPEVPEWSPTTAPCVTDSGVDGTIREDGNARGASREDVGFRVCGDGEVVHGGAGDGRNNGGGGGGLRDGTPHPFERMDVAKEEGEAGVGEGVGESDDKLVALLRERPKNVPQIRTRESFRSYFRGMDRERLGRLLREAYADRGSEECDAKVKKRLMLLERSLDAAFR